MLTKTLESIYKYHHTITKVPSSYEFRNYNERKLVLEDELRHLSNNNLQLPRTDNTDTQRTNNRVL